MRGLAIAALCAGLACGRSSAPLYPAGTPQDDGHGDLARASVRLELGAAPAAPAAEPPTAPAAEPDDAIGGPLGGDAYGGATYAGYVVPVFPQQRPDRRPRYRQTEGLSGSIAGVVTWRGAPPAALTTACGAVPGPAVGPDRALAGALVYIERLAVGRTPPTDRPALVGGAVFKRGCALVPAVQVAAPPPAPLVIHGDTRPARLALTTPNHEIRAFELQAGGRVAVVLTDGITRIDAADSALASAWVVALDTPAYALTDDAGRFRLDELAAGTYDVTVFHPAAPLLVRGALIYPPPLVVRRTVRVDTASTSRLDVAL